MTFNYYNVADDTTGEIVLQLGLDTDNDPDAVTNNTPTGHTAYIGESADKPSEVYYVAGVLTPRPLFSTTGGWNTTAIDADGVDDATFSSGLPSGTEIVVLVPPNMGLDIPGPIYETSGSFSLTTTVPGSYTVLFSLFPYIGAFQEIIAS